MWLQASLPSLKFVGRTEVIHCIAPSHTAAQQGSGPSRGPIPNATMAYTDPSTQRVSSSLHASTSSNYQADFSRFKEDLAGVLKTKHGIDLGSSHLYQKPYPPEFDFISYLVGWRVPEFIKFNGDDTRTTWEHVSQYILQLGEAGFNDAFPVCLFSLSLTGTAFSWFSSLAPNSILNWNQLESKFRDQFCSGENEAKLLDLTSLSKAEMSSHLIISGGLKI